MKLSVNTEIALTHILTRKKQTIIASLGVTIGIAMFIFSNSMMKGFGKYSRDEMFKVMPHLRVYVEDETSKPLFHQENDNLILIFNPKIITKSKSLNDPNKLLNDIKKQEYIKYAAPIVNVDIFYNNGKSQLRGVGNGVNIEEADAMFNIQSTMLAGNLHLISSNSDNIVIGKGIAEKLNLGINDNVTITSSIGVIKVMRIVGVFSTGNKATDQSKSYININSAQQLINQGPTYVSEIYANTESPDDSRIYSEKLQNLTKHKVEDWQTANADILAGDKIRDIMGIIIPVTIMLVAAFGIYNILNMTITQKLNDIAILKASGFSSSDITKIFLSEVIIMGILGSIIGICLGALCISLLKNMYMGSPVGYFPIFFTPSIFFISAVFGMLVTICAGYFPSRKAAKVDPVAIFRR